MCLALTVGSYTAWTSAPLLPLQHPIAITPAQSQNGAVEQRQIEVAVPGADDVLDPVDLHDRRPVDPGEVGGIEPALELTHRHPDDKTLTLHVQVRVVRGRLDPVDVDDADEHDALMVLDGEP